MPRTPRLEASQPSLPSCRSGQRGCLDAIIGHSSGQALANQPIRNLAQFYLVCEVGGELAVARWAAGNFVCDQALLDIGAVLVAYNEVVGWPEGALPIHASLAPERPLALLLSLMKAADRVVACQAQMAVRRA